MLYLRLSVKLLRKRTDNCIHSCRLSAIRLSRSLRMSCRGICSSNRSEAIWLPLEQGQQYDLGRFHSIQGTNHDRISRSVPGKEGCSGCSWKCEYTAVGC